MSDEHFLPWAVSNSLALILLLFCWKWPKGGRISYAIVFWLASIANTLSVLHDPRAYLDYGVLSILPLYRSFIYGFFAEYTIPLVLFIAFCQLLIGFGLFMHRKYYRLSLLAGVVFSVGIMPLGIGAGFPVPLIMIISLGVLFRKDQKARRTEAK